MSEGRKSTEFLTRFGEPAMAGLGKMMARTRFAVSMTMILVSGFLNFYDKLDGPSLLALWTAIIAIYANSEMAEKSNGK